MVAIVRHYRAVSGLFIAMCEGALTTDRYTLAYALTLRVSVTLVDISHGILTRSVGEGFHRHAIKIPGLPNVVRVKLTNVKAR